MEARSDVRIELSYDEGLQLRLLTPEPVPVALTPVLARFAEVQGRPAMEALPVVLDALRQAGVDPGLSPDASMLRDLSTTLVEQDDAMHRWLNAREAGPGDTLRTRLKPHQLRGAAFLAFRGSALLADPRGMEPLLTAVAACEIMRSVRGAKRVAIVSPESRHALWQSQIPDLSGQQVTVISGARAHRRGQYSEASSYVLITPEDLVKDRADLETWGVDLLVLDDVPRIWGIGSRFMEAARKLNVGRLLAVSPIDPLLDPEAFHGVLALIAPTVAGPRSAWEARYIDRSVKGHIRVVHEEELRSRVGAFLLRRDPAELSGFQLQSTREMRRVPLSRAQRSTYDKAGKALGALLEKPAPTLPEQRKADEQLAIMREMCDSLGLRQDGQTDSSKLDELRVILEEEAVLAGRKVVVFSRWEAMTRQIADLAKQLHLGHVRHYRKLPIKRREGLMARFLEETDVKVLVATDTELIKSELSADLLIHFDAPWEPQLVTWRRARVQGPALEELALIAAETLEEGLWVLPKPATVDATEPIEEEEAGVPSVRLYGRQGVNLLRLKQILGGEVIGEPAVEDAMSGAPQPAEATAGSAMDMTMSVAGAVGGAEPVSVMAAVDAGMEMPAAAEMAMPAVDAGMEMPAAAEMAMPAPDAGMAMSTNMNGEAAGVHDGMASEVMDREPDTVAQQATESPFNASARMSGSSGDRYAASSGASEAGMHAGTGADDMLYLIEIPLKAVNRILAGVPVIGVPLSRANGALWELVSGRMRVR